MVGGRPQVLWEGLAELRADTPSKARGAEGERGRPPPSSNTQCPITPGTRQARPTKIATFPRDKAEKSPQNQHVLPFNPNPLIPITRALRVIGHFVLLGLVPGVVVGGGVVEFVEADCVAPAGDDAGGLVCLAGVVPGIFEGCVGGHGRQDRRCWLRVS